MSMPFTFLPSANNDSSNFQGVWARMFGHFIESAREKAGLSIESAAELAGMDPRNWRAAESGAWLPTTRQQLQFMAAALDIEWETMAKIVCLCRQAWGVK